MSECYTCGGSGEGMFDGTTCRVCMGTGIDSRYPDEDDEDDKDEVEPGEDECLNPSEQSQAGA